MFFYGEKETLFLDDSHYVVIPRAKGAQRRVVEAKNDAQGAHVAEWLEAVRTRGSVSCPPAEAYRSTATVQLAMIALESGGRVDWDPDSEQVAGNPAAAALAQARLPRAVGAPLAGMTGRARSGPGRPLQRSPRPVTR